MCNYDFFMLTVAFPNNQKKLRVEPNRANRNTLRANFLLRVDYFFSQKIRKTEKFLRLEGVSGSCVVERARTVYLLLSCPPAMLLLLPRRFPLPISASLPSLPHKLYLH